jgi:hypothetical protein
MAYRPTVSDFTTTKTQQLSLADAGKFDAKFRNADGTRKLTTEWTRVCIQRGLKGLSRKARISQRRSA